MVATTWLNRRPGVASPIMLMSHGSRTHSLTKNATAIAILTVFGRHSLMCKINQVKPLLLLLVRLADLWVLTTTDALRLICQCCRIWWRGIREQVLPNRFHQRELGLWVTWLPGIAWAHAHVRRLRVIAYARIPDCTRAAKFLRQCCIDRRTPPPTSVSQVTHGE